MDGAFRTSHAHGNPSGEGTSNPTLALIGEVLGRCDTIAKDLWFRPIEAGEAAVVVNGVRVPVVRIAWNDVERFFDGVFATANERCFRHRLPCCRRTWNSRFRRLAGRIDCRDRHIELSSAHFEACGAGALAVVLVHELIHLSLFVDRRPYGHTAEFKARSQRIGLPGIYHDLPLPDRIQRRRRIHLYRCRCGKLIESRVRFRSPRACADCCQRHAGGQYDARYRLKYAGLMTAS